MLEIKKSNIKISLVQNKMPEVIVALSWPVESLSGLAYRLVQSGHSHQQADVAAIAYAVAQQAESAIATPNLALKSRAGVMCSGAVGSHLVISWQMKGVLSHIIGSIKKVCKKINPQRVIPIYKNIMSKIGVKPDVKSAAAAINACVKGLREGLSITIIGGVKLYEAKDAAKTSKIKKSAEDLADAVSVHVKNLQTVSGGAARKLMLKTRHMQRLTLARLVVSC